MADWLEIAKVAVGPIAGAVTGLASSLLGLKKRMDSVERKVRKQDSTLQGHIALFEGVDGEIEALREEMRTNHEKVEDFINSIRNSNQDFAKDAELVNFISEQQAQWQQFERTLGRIEGHLGLNQHNQPMTVPRPQPRPMTTSRTPFPTEYQHNPQAPRRKS